MLFVIKTERCGDTPFKRLSRGTTSAYLICSANFKEIIMNKMKVKMVRLIFSLYKPSLCVLNDSNLKEYNEKIIEIAKLVVDLYTDQIKQSDPIEQKALKMRYQEDMSFEDISTSLGYVNHSSATRLISKYFENLAQKLTDERT